MREEEEHKHAKGKQHAPCLLSLSLLFLSLSLFSTAQQMYTRQPVGEGTAEHTGKEQYTTEYTTIFQFTDRGSVLSNQNPTHVKLS